MTEKPEYSAIILAGGQSSRMARPKAQLPFGSSTLLEHIVAELKKAFDNLVVVAAPSDAMTNLRGVRIVHDDVAYAGPVSALEIGITAARNEIAFACSCDVPFVNGDLALKLCAMLGDHDALIPRVDGKLQTLHAVYRKKCAKVLGAMRTRGERRLHEDEFRQRAVLPEEEVRALNPDLRSFFNVNTPEDYQLALKIMDEEFKM